MIGYGRIDELMKRRIRIYVFVGLLILLVGIVGARFRNSNFEFHNREKRTETPTTNGDQQANDAYVGEYKVARVIDGDTIEIEGGERVRYIGMDTPETVDPKKLVQCFGKEASDENKQLVEGKTVRLGKDTTERDRYGRLLRYVYVGDTFVNLQLVALGFAHADAFPPDILHQEWFDEAERAARGAGLGLWRACK